MFKLFKLYRELFWPESFILCLVILLSCSQSNSNSHEGQDDNGEYDIYFEDNIDFGSLSVHPVDVRDTNVDSLEKVHEDSMLFMNYWVGMSGDEFNLVSYHNYQNELLKEGEGDIIGWSDKGLYTVLNFDGHEGKFFLHGFTKWTGELEELELVIYGEDFPYKNYYMAIENAFDEKYGLKDSLPYTTIYRNQVVGEEKKTEYYKIDGHKAVSYKFENFELPYKRYTISYRPAVDVIRNLKKMKEKEFQKKIEKEKKENITDSLTNLTFDKI